MATASALSRIGVLLLVLLGLGRGVGGLTLLAEPPAGFAPALARLAALGLVLVAQAAFFAAWRLWQQHPDAGVFVHLALGLFVLGGIANGFLWFGQPTGTGTLMNLALAALISSCVRVGARRNRALASRTPPPSQGEN
ncbi:MAG: hypothetical protein IT369_11130 [Candidatus Latescibacteria bacterium]|nr:hypothetical protein [Candidatus Latescibacterota bacterium]